MAIGDACAPNAHKIVAIKLIPINWLNAVRQYRLYRLRSRSDRFSICDEHIRSLFVTVCPSHVSYVNSFYVMATATVDAVVIVHRFYIYDKLPYAKRKEREKKTYDTHPALANVVGRQSTAVSKYINYRKLKFGVRWKRKARPVFLCHVKFIEWMQCLAVNFKTLILTKQNRGGQGRLKK